MKREKISEDVVARHFQITLRLWIHRSKLNKWRRKFNKEHHNQIAENQDKKENVQSSQTSTSNQDGLTGTTVLKTLGILTDNNKE